MGGYGYVISYKIFVVDNTNNLWYWTEYQNIIYGVGMIKWLARKLRSKR